MRKGTYEIVTREPAQKIRNITLLVEGQVQNDVGYKTRQEIYALVRDNIILKIERSIALNLDSVLPVSVNLVW